MNTQANRLKIPFFIHAVFWIGVMFVLYGFTTEYTLHHAMSVPNMVFGGILIFGSALTANQRVKKSKEDNS